MTQRNPVPGGYSLKRRISTKPCSCCGVNKVGKGNRFLCNRCFADSYNHGDRPDPNKITCEDAQYLSMKVCDMEETPPTPVMIYLCEEYTQKELRAILDGGCSE